MAWCEPELANKNYCRAPWILQTIQLPEAIDAVPISTRTKGVSDVNKRSIRRVLAALLPALCLGLWQPAQALTLFLKAGEFFGPGITGDHAFDNAFVTNLQFTGPLQGVVPFFNNGANPPFVLAQQLFGGPQTGFTSDGRAINKNANTGLFLDLTDPGTGESAKMMVVSIATDEFGPDALGNIAFHAHVVADPGVPSEVVPFEVTFTTGAVTIPKSLRTQMGLPGGHETAGSLPTGTVIFGRVGDFDHDGFMDGELVIGQNSPLNLVVARGDPIAQRRPWISDIPVSTIQSAVLNLNGIVMNFPKPMSTALASGQVQAVLEEAFDVSGRLNAALFDVTELILNAASPKAVEDRAHAARSRLYEGRDHLDRAIDELGRPDHDDHYRGGKEEQREVAEHIQRAFAAFGQALAELSSLSSQG